MLEFTTDADRRYESAAADVVSSKDLDSAGFRWLFDSAPDAMLMVDGAGRITRANAQVERLFGYPLPELIGEPVELLVPRRLRGMHVSHREAYSANPRTRPMGAGLALYGLRKDGSEFPLEISLSPLSNAQETLSLAAIRDVTERKRTEEELTRYRDHLEEVVQQRTEALQREIAERRRIEERQQGLIAEVEAANEELQRFAYVVSHDLKAPLRAIESLATWIAEDYAERLDEEGRAQLTLLTQRAHRMDRLIDGILQYSRLGRIREERVELNLEQVLREAVDLLGPPQSAQVRVLGRLPHVRGERTRMQQVFQNLIGNAIRHNDKAEPIIEVSCSELPEAWRISVKDNGPGIEERHFERIFDMFQTLAPRDRVESTGVGLTLVKRIVEHAGGRVWVESAPGQGATFHFTLPKDGEGHESS